MKVRSSRRSLVAVMLLLLASAAVSSVVKPAEQAEAGARKLQQTSKHSILFACHSQHVTLVLSSDCKHRSKACPPSFCMSTYPLHPPLTYPPLVQPWKSIVPYTHRQQAAWNALSEVNDIHCSPAQHLSSCTSCSKTSHELRAQQYRHLKMYYVFHL